MRKPFTESCWFSFFIFIVGIALIVALERIQ